MKKMGRYLVVAHQTATSGELLSALKKEAAQNPYSSFTILVPVMPSPTLITDQTAALIAAERRAVEARDLFAWNGLLVEDMLVGDSSPILAIEDELRVDDGYDAIVLSTFPPGISRWLRMDTHALAERKFGLPVIHVIAGQRAAKLAV